MINYTGQKSDHIFLDTHVSRSLP